MEKLLREIRDTPTIGGGRPLDLGTHLGHTRAMARNAYFVSLHHRIRLDVNIPAIAELTP